MSQPPSNPGQDPQWDPQHAEGDPPQQPSFPDGPADNGPDGPLGPDGRPHQGTQFGVKQLLAALLIVAVLGVVGFFVWQNFQKDAALAVGNCLVITGELEDADHELVGCEDQTVYSQYVGEVIDGGGECSDSFAAPYTISETDRGGNATDVTKVACLVPQLFEGRCYAQLPEGQVNDLEPVDCSSKDLEVTKVVDETGAQCDEGSEAIDFTVPARTYCIAFEA